VPRVLGYGRHDHVEYIVMTRMPGVAALTVEITGGTHLRRDNEMSVRYAEELHSGTSAVLLQRADRHGIVGEKPSDFQVPL
jgi:hypothetical protein